jgi:Bacteriophage abortive infection AbiH
MNRLIIIGNGFDIAHGMPTKYSDFVKWYLTNLFIRLGKEDFDDESIRASENNQTRITRKESSELIISKLESPKTEQDSFLTSILNNEHGNISSQNFHRFYIDFKYPFLKDICLFYVDKNWVDIENLFYKKLLLLKKLDVELEFKNAQIDLLNKGMDYLKKKLEEYLTTITPPNLNQQVLDIINPRANALSINSQDRVLITNFNYTRTINNYLNVFNNDPYYYTPTTNIFIHGEIGNTSNPLIFGFGDEMDDEYKVLEKTNHNPYLDNMKSFGYFKTNNYQEIASFINSDDSFEVFVMGHSCGLSDRVMLNMIFEHYNCKSIKIFYYDDGRNNNYKTLTQEISRHFNKKNDMRLKIVPFEDSIPLPQLK